MVFGLLIFRFDPLSDLTGHIDDRPIFVRILDEKNSMNPTESVVSLVIDLKYGEYQKFITYKNFEEFLHTRKIRI